ncbi:GNAT family N-acetyltransferase [Agromyces sp. LHK192]|uniref:GNAT family N-acetyltransferase n=1 Tax=Agromyces sp. LHK192 TaxID=2498704 RepID=UPI000FDAC153|nr:GNAT family protein [Agromyces sp. LHK192]
MTEVDHRASPPDLRLPFDVDRPTPLRLETGRLVLRPLETSDAADVWEYQRLPEVLRYIPWPERSREDAWQHTAKRAGMRRLAEAGDGCILAMELVGEPSVGRGEPGGRVTHDGPARNRVIGDIMLRVADVEHAQLEVGWVVHPAFQGRGLATEAAEAALGFAFDTLRPHRVLANLDARNAASAHLCERLGMRHEATILEEQFNDGAWEDTAIYGILDREWAARLG